MGLPVPALVIIISSCLFSCSKTSSSFLERLLNEPFLVFVSCSLMFFCCFYEWVYCMDYFCRNPMFALLLNLYSLSDRSAYLRKSWKWGFNFVYITPFCLFYFEFEQSLKVFLEHFFCVKLIICPAGLDWSLIVFLIAHCNLIKLSFCLVWSLKLNCLVLASRSCVGQIHVFWIRVLFAGEWIICCCLFVLDDIFLL